MPGVLDLTAGLRSLQLQAGHEELLVLRSRIHSLMLHAGAHCVFYCKLLQHARQRLESGSFTSSGVRPGLQGLHVGVVGGGHLGKQLVHFLITLAGIRPQKIRVSTRRPEMLSALQDLGVECFYDNQRLARWAQVVFLCCLPSQLPAVCADIRGHLMEDCVVYSLVSAIPISRLQSLLSHSNVVRPEYRSEGDTDAQEWGEHRTLTEALTDGSFVKATNPAERPCDGGIRLVSRFLEPALYSVLNMCTTYGLTRAQSLRVLNDVIQEGPEQGPLITAGHVVREEVVALQDEDRPFPWFDLCRVQMTESPLSLRLGACQQLRQRLSRVYSNGCHVPGAQP